MSVPVRFTVRGLLGSSDDYVVNFPADHEFHIIYGPNGVGKTKYLETIQALCSLSVGKLISLPVSGAHIEYSDGSMIAYQNLPESGALAIHWREPDGNQHAWNVDEADLAQAERFRSGASEWYQIEPGLWRDMADGEILSEDEFRAVYGDSAVYSIEMPPAMTAYVEAQSSLFIRTQRLLEYRDNLRSARRPFRNPSGRLRNKSTVSRYAADIRNLLREALTANSRTTANLDRTFPSRLLGNSGVAPTEESEIRQRYATQNSKRGRLARLSLIGPESDLALPERDLEVWERRVLQMYLDDTEAKLKTFDTVLEKVELLEDIVNRRFLQKQIVVTADEGLQIKTESGHAVSPDDLSSGEQHELIMFYDLLFNVSPGALVLIDEPEISLHVTWQREFLNDMMRVSQLSSARILVATHSPQIIGKWRDRATPISPYADEAFD